MPNSKTKENFLKRKTPIRLKNNSGICYLNSIINCLLSSYPFYLLSKFHLNSCQNKTCLIASLNILFHLENAITTKTDFFKILQSKHKISKGKWPDTCLIELLTEIQNQPCYSKRHFHIKLGSHKNFKYILFGDQLCLIRKFLDDLTQKVDEVYCFNSVEYKLESMIRLILFDVKDKSKICWQEENKRLNKQDIGSHVVSYVKISGCWFKCNDFKIFKTNFQNIKSKFGNYMLFYKKYKLCESGNKESVC